MSGSRTIGLERLASAARAAGFAMATPDDRPEDVPASSTQAVSVAKSNWTSAAPQRALVVVAARPVSLQASVRDWFASLSWRAPA